MRCPITDDHKKALMRKQKGLCLYCQNPFGSVVWKGDRHGKVVTLKPTVEHLVPRAFGLKFFAKTTALACQICNPMRGTRIFQTIEQAREWMAQRWKERNLEVISWETPRDSISIGFDWELCDRK